MDLDLPPDDDPRRLELRAWLAEHPDPDRATLAAACLVAPHWPRPWGLDADPEHQLIIDAELAEAGVEPISASIAVGWAGPTILAGGTQEQQQRWLPGILDGSEEWSQLFSEPEAGSDLAALRTRAVRDGDHYVVDGQKIWSTWANHSDWGILLARTSTEGRKQDGITYFVVDLRSPGIDIRPIIEMTGGNHFNEVFFDGLRIPVDQRIGEENAGWRLAKVTLGNERLSLSEGGCIWGMGPTSRSAFDRPAGSADGADADLVRDVVDPVVRQRAAAVHGDMQILELFAHRLATAAIGGDDPGPVASIRKTLADEHGQHLTSLVKDRRGAHGMVGPQDEHAEDTDPWHWAYLFSRALTIGGGTSEVQRSIIGERLLGLPREPNPS